MTDLYLRLIGTYEILLVSGKKDLFGVLKVTDEGESLNFVVKSDTGVKKFKSLDAACGEMER